MNPAPHNPRCSRDEKRHRTNADGEVGHDLLIVLALLIALDLGAWRWSHDSRDGRDRWRRAQHLTRGGRRAVRQLRGFAALPERRRLRLVWAASVGYGALVAVSLGQTAAGLAPFDVGVVGAVLALLGMVLLGVAFLAALLALRHPAPAPT